MDKQDYINKSKKELIDQQGRVVGRMSNYVDSCTKYLANLLKIVTDLKINQQYVKEEFVEKDILMTSVDVACLEKPVMSIRNFFTRDDTMTLEETFNNFNFINDLYIQVKEIERLEKELDDNTNKIIIED